MDETTNSQDRHGDNSWHLDKRISFSHLITTMAIIISLFTWGSTLDKRLTLLEESAKRQEEAIKQDRESIRILNTEIRGELSRLNDKMNDVLIRSGIRENSFPRTP